MMPQSPLDDIISVSVATDQELRAALRNASAEADRLLRSIDDRPSLRRAQLAFAKVNTELWSTVKDATTVGIGDAFDQAAMWQSRYDYELFRAAGFSGTHWQQSVLAQSRVGLESYMARKQNGMTLSQRVYRNRALTQGYVDRAINNALLLGKSPAELATDVKRFIDPNTPGGASYAAMRLGRTEVVNAYHESAKARYKSTPWVEKVKWNLSGSHPRPDICNELAEDRHFRKMGPGEFPADSVPPKPHPQCFCYITPVSMSLDEYAKRFESGQYDDYINEQMGCFHVA